MKISLGVVMDPINQIKIHKDSTFAMLLEAQARDWDIWYLEQKDILLADNQVIGQAKSIEVADTPDNWFKVTSEQEKPLKELDVILMRKDPPFDMQYIYTTYLLELSGSLVINHPQALRDYNEKLSTAWFPQCCAPFIVASQPAQFLEFLDLHKDIIIKPLDGMGGASIFRIKSNDPNTNVILETLTQHGSRHVMAQRFIPEITLGDKRILIVDGNPVPFALARIPQQGENRGNLAVGGSGIGVELTDRDYWICEQLAPELKRRGIVFAGIDVIGDYLTEINITSPTCIRELDNLYQLNISAQLMDAIEEKLAV